MLHFRVEVYRLSKFCEEQGVPARLCTHWAEGGKGAADLAQAVMLLAAHYYEYRDETALAEGCMPFGVASLIERYRIVRLYGGGAR